METGEKWAARLGSGGAVSLRDGESTVSGDRWGQAAEQWECAQCEVHVQTVVRAAAQFAQTNKNQVKDKEKTAEERKEGGRRKGKTSRKWRRIETMYLSPKFKCKNLKKMFSI